MSNTFRSQISEVMCLAWQMVKRNGYTMSEALKTAWTNIKLRVAMKERIVKFYFQKVDGSIREAYGTLKDSLLPKVQTTVKRVTPYKLTSIQNEESSDVSRKRI